MRKFKVNTQHLVVFEKYTMIEFDGVDSYKKVGDQTDRSLPQVIVENNPLWFIEIVKDEK